MKMILGVTFAISGIGVFTEFSESILHDSKSFYLVGSNQPDCNASDIAELDCTPLFPNAEEPFVCEGRYEAAFVVQQLKDELAITQWVCLDDWCENTQKLSKQADECDQVLPPP